MAGTGDAREWRPARAGARAAALVAGHALGRVVRGRRAVVLAALLLLPVLMALGYGPVIPSREIPVEGFYATLAMMLFLQLLVPLASLALATGLISDEADRGTLLYLFTRPVPKGSVLAGKFAAHLGVGAGVIALSFSASYLALRLRPGGGAIGEAGGLAPYLGVLLLGLLPYGALFALLGTLLRRPMIPAIAFAFGWEGLLANLPGQTRLLTIMHYLRVLLRRLAGERFPPLKEPFFAFDPSSEPGTAACLLVLAGITAACLAAAAVTLRRRQFALSRP